MAVANHFALLRSAVCLLEFFTFCGLASAQTLTQASCVVRDIETPTMPACVIQSEWRSLYPEEILDAPCIQP